MNNDELRYTISGVFGSVDVLSNYSNIYTLINDGVLNFFTIYGQIIVTNNENESVVFENAFFHKISDEPLEFFIESLSENQLQNLSLQSQIDYLSMMTGINLNDVAGGGLSQSFIS